MRQLTGSHVANCLKHRGLQMWVLNVSALVALLTGSAVPLLPSLTAQGGLSPAAVPAVVAVTPMTTVTPVATPPAVATEAVTANTPTTAGVRQNLVVLGDSVASGYGCSCGGFAADLAKANGPAALTNDAENGLTSAGLLAELSSPMLQAALASATVVTVTIGANDFDESQAANASCVNATCYAATLETMTTAITQITSRISQLTKPGSTVVLTGYWNVFLDGAVGAGNGANYVATSDALTRQVNASIAQIASQQHMLYADVYTPFKGDGSHDDTALLVSDGDHPNAAGHLLIAAAIAAASHLVST